MVDRELAVRNFEKQLRSSKITNGFVTPAEQFVERSIKPWRGNAHVQKESTFRGQSTLPQINDRNQYKRLTLSSEQVSSRNSPIVNLAQVQYSRQNAINRAAFENANYPSLDYLYNSPYLPKTSGIFMPRRSLP